MKKKSIIAYILTLIITTALLPASGIIEGDENNYFKYTQTSNLPDDFELIGYSISNDTWNDNYKLEINNDGLSKYYCMYHEDREQLKWTLVKEFTISADAMGEIWNEILDNDFFNLDDLYESPVSESGGDYARLTITGNGQTHDVKTVNIVVPKFDRIILKINMLTPEDSNLIYNALFKYKSNSCPFKPDKPSGETNGENGNEYEYSTSCIDPEFNKVWYLFDWGDGTDSGWIGPYNYGEEASAKHTWSSKGTYNVKVKARDEFEAESVWSDPLAVSMPKIKQKDDTILLKIIGLFRSNDFQTGILSLRSFILNYLLDEKTINSLHQSIVEQSLWITNPVGNVATVSFQNGSFTKVEIEGCNITVNLYIEIFGSGTTAQGGTVSASDIESSIEDFWNRKNGEGNWYIRCKEKEHDCNNTEPGCKVTFDVTVKNTAENENLSSGNWSETGYWKNNSNANGYHQIRIINNSGWRSVVYTWPPYNGPAGNWPPNDGTDPYSGNNNRLGGIWSGSASAKVYAHEAGHLMGLDDQYQDVNGTSVPNPGYETNIMASVSKCNETANMSDIENIVNHGGVYCPCDCCPEENDTEEPEVNIDTPQPGPSSTPVNVKGTATDTGGSGIVELKYKIEWTDGSYNGQSIYYSPPEEWIGFIVGPIYLEQFIEIGEWIKIIIYAIDDAGNIGSDEVTVIYEGEEDNTPPVTEKIIGEPNEEGGYLIWPFTPITFEATDDMSGVNYIYYEVWWDSNEDGIVDMLMAEKTVDGSFVTFSVDMYGIFVNTIELRWYAVDNANNFEDMHYQQHLVAG